MNTRSRLTNARIRMITNVSLSLTLIIIAVGCEQRHGAEHHRLEERGREIQRLILTEGEDFFDRFLEIASKGLPVSAQQPLDEGFCRLLLKRTLDQSDLVYVTYLMMILLDAFGDTDDPPCDPDLLGRAYASFAPESKRLWLYWAVGADNVDFLNWVDAEQDFMALARDEEDLVVYAWYSRSCRLLSMLARGNLLPGGVQSVQQRCPG